MKTRKTMFFLPALVLTLILHEGSSAQEFEIPKSVVGSGGQPTANADFSLNGTVGQPAIGITANAENVNQAGFWYQVVSASIIVDVAGDVTGDGIVDVTDLIGVINLILGIGSPPFPDRADVNNDGIVDVADLIAIINIILGIGG